VGQLLAATAAIATDPELLADAGTRVRDRGLTPERAVWEAIEAAADAMRVAGSRQALRVSDLYGVRNRMVALLTGRPAAGIPDPGRPFVLLAGDLAPADAAELDAARCLASSPKKADRRLIRRSSPARSAFRQLSRRAV
jgi:phosphoenolpyruvate-protein kinase (PTS system EI component)